MSVARYSEEELTDAGAELLQGIFEAQVVPLDEFPVVVSQFAICIRQAVEAEDELWEAFEGATARQVLILIYVMNTDAVHGTDYLTRLIEKTRSGSGEVSLDDIVGFQA